MEQSAFLPKPITSARLHISAIVGRSLQRALKAVLQIPREELSPAGCWLEDHGRFLLSELHSLRRSLRESPRLPGKDGIPRLLLLARAICREENILTASLILKTARSLLADQEITQEELHYLPSALKIALFEQLEEAFSACIAEENLRSRARKWIGEMKQDGLNPLPENPELMEKVLSLLAADENQEALERMDSLLSQEGERAEEAARAAHEAMNRLGLKTGWAIQSLHQLQHLPFDGIAERLSPVVRILREEETYRRMDEKSRQFYQFRVCHLAKRMHLRQSAVARAALDLARDHTGPEGEAGYYLIERPDLIGSHLLQKKSPSFWQKRKEGLFVLLLWLGAALFLGLGALFSIPALLWPLMLLCGSEITRIFLYRFLRRRFPSRMLPRLRIRRLSREKRTLIVAPTLLTSPRQALQMARQLSILRHANPDAHLEFMVLGDFADAPRQEMEKDEEILHTARESILALNQSLGGGFYYLHRKRTFDEGQQCFTGRERKRGALEALNQLIVNGKTDDAFAYMSCDRRHLHHRYAYVITLDADTFLPPGAARRLIGAMEHPLQKGRIGVIQPRMETAAHAVRTRTQLFLGGRGGMDIYASSSQDIYQDVFGRGSFVGKGIYAPEAWLKAMEGRVKPGRLLSHDLIEGEIVGSALAEDIVCLDGHPARLSGWQKRLHRWTRGDWQLLPFLRDRRLSLLSRHKIWDNMRRSLVPFGQILLLIIGAALGRPLLCLIGLPWPFSGMGRRLLLLPAKAYTLLDAICRALYRQLISHRGLLSWVTAAQAEQGPSLPMPCILIQLIAGALLSLCALLPGGFLPMVFLGLAWVLSPLLPTFLDSKIRGEAPFSPRQIEHVRALARDTWRFFEESVTENTLFLPPDNVQVDPDKGPAMRTSPTNIGLYLLSCCAARELGFITSHTLAHRLSASLSSLERLETWKGQFYNWYELYEGKPLPPLFVSTVDSGNLAGCLFACAQYCRKRLSEMPQEQHTLPARMDALLHKMDFSLLYDEKKHLFFVGWDQDHHRFTPAHYDLMASEARITSFFAVMTGQAPLKHWQHLNRTLTRAGGGPALISWGGTMFEYLMPALLLPHLPGTLLGESCLNAIRAQMSHHHRLPFGVSESGYYAFDPDLNYQYRAFGLPRLALSGETEGKVIAPYASMLALPFFPGAAAANLRQMQKLGWADQHGLFEAADYTPQRVEGSPMLVKSHMAHHQGMILCAACNALCDQALVKSFMSPPSAWAYAHLLMEKAPRHARRPPDMPPPREDKEQMGELRRYPQKTLPMDAQALHGKGITWLLSAQGQGYLAAGNWMITRFFEEAGSQTGPQFYLRDVKTGQYIRPAVQGKAHFDAGSVSFSMAWQGLRILLRCCVAPLSGMAIAHFQVENPSKEAKEIEAISFLEPAQGNKAADQAHSNFRDLSLRIRPLGDNGLISLRLPRNEEEEEDAIGHWVSGDISALTRQGDRLLFLGRSGSYAAPEQLNSNAQDCSFRLGDVITPCLSLRAGMRIQPGGSGQLFFQTGLISPHAIDAAVPLSPEKALAAFALSATQTKMTLRFLRMDARLFHAAQQLLGAAAFYGQPHQALLSPASQNALWRYGVSGNLPVLLVLPKDNGDKSLIRQMLKIHGFLHMQKVETDLIFFCQEENSYHKPLRDLISSLISLSPDRDLMGREGGVHLISGGEEEALALSSLARIVIQGGQSLNGQLSALRKPFPQPEPGALALASAPAAPPLAAFNGYGGFTQEGDYAILAPAPVPWHNLICSEHFGTLVSDRSILHSYGENSRLGRITRPSPDVYRGVGSEELLLRTQDGTCYSLISGLAIHSPGETVYHTQCAAVQSRIALFAPPDLSLSLRMITLRSEENTAVRLHWLVRFAMGERPETTRCRAEESRVLAENGEMNGTAWAALAGSQVKILSPSLCPELRETGLSSSALAGMEGPGSAALFTLELELKAREPVTMLAALGHALQPQEIPVLYDQLCGEGGQSLLRRTRAFWQQRLSALTLFSSDTLLNFMMNKWLPYQAQAARLMARMGPYQAGGAFGFRDQLQDLLSLLHTRPDFARNHILLCAAHQFIEGDVQHWWHMPRRGVRTRISDDKLFLPYLTALYIRITGDQTILDESVPYLESAPLAEHEDDRYEEPSLSSVCEPLMDHCIRAINSVALGVHDLPLMGSGDWNDGMNRVGGKRGESVWLGFFLAVVLKEFAPLCPKEIKEKYNALRRCLLEGAEQAWTGRWYLRAWYDSGEPLGGPNTDPPRIDLISQCFAALAGAPREHAREALRHAVHMLYDRNRGMVKLLDPPFTPDEKAGYIGGYLPGVRENGGQYTHAAPWLVMALCKFGEYSLAWEIARALLPARHSDTKEKADCYKGEPYVLAGDVYAGENPGRSGWSWYTGSAAWLYYVYLTVLLGFEKQGDKARLSPCPEPGTEEYTLVYHYKNTRYHFTAARDVLFATLDGEKLHDGWALLQDDGKTHEARFPLRSINA